MGRESDVGERNVSVCNDRGEDWARMLLEGKEIQEFEGLAILASTPVSHLADVEAEAQRS